FGVLLGLLVLDSRESETRFAVLIAVATALLIGGTGFAFWQRMKTIPISRWLWTGAFFACIILGAGLGYLLATRLKQSDQHLDILESIVLVLAVAGILFLVLHGYDRRRPGVLKWGLILSAVLLAGPLTFYSLHTRLEKFQLASTVPQFWV